jgi:3-phenylpropionate/trans-cinnamate dioxygenase ferredoxin subunit
LKVSDVPPGTKRVVDASGTSVLVCNSDGQLYAIASLCSHQQQKLECGRMQRGWIACPVHGARFALATGRAMNPPATKPIATYAVRVVEDWIEVLV